MTKDNSLAWTTQNQSVTTIANSHPNNHNVIFPTHLISDEKCIINQDAQRRGVARAVGMNFFKWGSWNGGNWTNSENSEVSAIPWWACYIPTVLISCTPYFRSLYWSQDNTNLIFRKSSAQILAEKLLRFYLMSHALKTAFLLYLHYHASFFQIIFSSWRDCPNP